VGGIVDFVTQSSRLTSIARSTGLEFRGLRGCWQMPGPVPAPCGRLDMRYVRTLGASATSLPLASVVRFEPALAQYSFSELISKIFGQVFVARQDRSQPSVFFVTGSVITVLPNGNSNSGYRRAMCCRWVRPGCANRSFMKIPLAPPIQFMIPSNTILPFWSWLNPRYRNSC